MEIHAFFDVDRTIRKGSAALDFCNYLLSKGLVNDTFTKTDYEVRRAYQMGEIDYRAMVDGVVTIHASVLKGLNHSKLVNYYQSFVQEVDGLFEWTIDLFKRLKLKDAKTTLVSAGISPAIASIGTHLGADNIFTSQPEIINDVYSGRISRILHDNEKGELIKNYINNIGSEAVKIGFGDSTGDISMLNLMDHAFIIDPHQTAMIDLSQENGWHLVRNRLELFSQLDPLLGK